jgi:hypothetical protein
VNEHVPSGPVSGVPGAVGQRPTPASTASIAAVAVPAMPPPGRISAELEPHWRYTAGIVGIGILVYACVLAWREETEGVATAAAFALALLALIFALAGVVPASVKVGDVEFKIRQAEESGKEQGGLEGFIAGTKVASEVKEGHMDPDAVVAATRAALTSDNPLRVPEVGVEVPVPKMASVQEANARVAEIAACFNDMK